MDENVKKVNGYSCKRSGLNRFNQLANVMDEWNRQTIYNYD